MKKTKTGTEHKKLRISREQVRQLMDAELTIAAGGASTNCEVSIPVTACQPNP